MSTPPEPEGCNKTNLADRDVQDPGWKKPERGQDNED